jgi:DNA-binding winged helix-turn-helix (wHTH) protein
VQHTVHLFDGFQLDVTRRKLISSGGLVQPLNSRAMEALLLLVANAGELVEKRRLMQTIWPDAVVEDNNLNQCILSIRKALGETAGSNLYIMTVPGRGYRFVSPVRSITRESGGDAAAQVPRRWSTQALWFGMLTAAGTALVMILLVGVTRGPADLPVTTTKAAEAAQDAEPVIVLRLHDAAPAAGAAADRSSTLLTQCLTANPAMKLRVQLQLVDGAGAPAWTGEYLAGAQDLLTTQAATGPAPAGCRELLLAMQSEQRRPSAH